MKGKYRQQVKELARGGRKILDEGEGVVCRCQIGGSEMSEMSLVNTMITFVPFVGLDNCPLLMEPHREFKFKFERI